MKRIVIEGLEEDVTDIAEALRLVAEDIENGYTSGIVGWSSVSWRIEDDD